MVDYDPAWPHAFETLRNSITETLRGIALSIEHVGSTSVPGLAAKPIIDIDAIVPSRADVPAAVRKLAALGYTHQGDLGVEDREAFENSQGIPAHNLYVCVSGALALRNHLAIRDFCGAIRGRRFRYGLLKKRLAAKFPDDIRSYVEGKTDLLVEILRNAGFCEIELEAIREVNRYE